VADFPSQEKNSPQSHRGTAKAKEQMIDLQKDPLTDKIIGCAIEVHRQLGPGLLESIYEQALCIELDH
jgi:PD-(D/E)XK nuclease superfamily